MNRDRRIGGGRLAALACLVAMGIACADDEAGRAGLPGNDEGFDDDGGGVGGKADETGPGAFSVVRRVAVLNYNPTWVNTTNARYASAAQLANQYIEVVRQASHGALEYRLAEITDGNFARGWAELDYAPPNRDGHVPDESLWHQCRGEAEACANEPDEDAKRECNEDITCGYLGYSQIVSDPGLGLCSRIEDNQVDEVWIFGVPGYPHAAESTMVGPSGYFINNDPVQVTCTSRNVPVMFFNRGRTVAQMLHNLGHRAEFTLVHAYGEDEGRYAEFALPANPIGIEQEVNVRRCGSVHFPPNSSAATVYDYSNATEHESQCMAFYHNYPNVLSLTGGEEKVSAADWGGVGLGQEAELPYLIWWFQHFPQVRGKDDKGNFNNWWRHVALFDQLHDGTSAQPGSCWSHDIDTCPADCEVRCETCLPPGAALECGGGGRQDLAAACAAETTETCGSRGYCTLAECYGESNVCALDGTGLQPCASPCDDPRRTNLEYCGYPRPPSELQSEQGCLWANVDHFEEDGDGIVDRSASLCRNGEDLRGATYAEVTEALFGIDELAPGCFEFEFHQQEEGNVQLQQIGCSNLDYLHNDGLDLMGPLNGLGYGSCQYFDSGTPALRCE